MKDMSFEKAFEKLEKVISDLEGGSLSLDDSLKKYEEGIALARLCQGKIDKAKERIEKLVKKEDGSFELDSFEPIDKGEK